MTQAQRDYAINQIENIEKNLIYTLQKAFDKEYPTPPLLSIEQKLQLIRSGKVKLKSQKTLAKEDDWRNKDINNCFDWTEFIKPKAPKEALRKIREKRDKIKTKAKELTDQIMLGDSEAALNLIKAFKNFHV